MWIKAADLGVFPHKAEGFGLPILETIACGTPIIVSNYSGSTEFTTGCKEAYHLNSGTHKKVYDPVFWPDGGPGTWFCPDVKEIAIKIMDFYHNPVESGKIAAEHAKSFTWEKSAKKIMELIA